MNKAFSSCAAVAVVLVSLALGGCADKQAPADERPLVRTQTIQIDAAGQTVQYSGEVRGRYETQLAFQVGGKVVKRHVEVGASVAAGDVLLEIDTKDIAQIVRMGSAQVESAQSQLQLTQTNLARYQTLYRQGAVSQLQLDQAQNSYDVALAAFRQASAQYDQGMNQLDYSKLRADQAGVIAGVDAEAGQVVAAGQTIVTVVRDGEREVEISVPENRLQQIRRGQQVSVGFWALPDMIMQGEVREVSPVADKITRTYKARISLYNPPADLGLGMTATVTAPVSLTGQGVFIPLTAVYQTGDSPHVWVVLDGVVNLRPVTLGAFSDNGVQVLAGLQDGDVIVIAGVQKLQPDQKVRL